MDLSLSGRGPKYQQVYDALREVIDQRRLTPGTRIPSSRQLASDLGLSRNTILRAMEMLRAEGSLHSRAASGVFVSDDAEGARPREARRPSQWPVDPKLVQRGARFVAKVGSQTAGWGFAQHEGSIDFRFGEPNHRDFPVTRWDHLVRRQLSRHGAAEFNYGPPEGVADLRRAIADHLRSARGLDANEQSLLIVSGSQQAFSLIGHVYGSDRVAALEDPGYKGAERALRFSGCRISHVPVDDDGLVVEALEKLPESPAVIVITPSHQFPTGHVMGLARRQHLLDWSRDRHVLLVEDDYDSEFRYDVPPLSPLKALDSSEHVLFVGTFSKVLFPAVRLGFIHAHPELLEPLRVAKAVSDTGCPTFFQHVLASFIDGGDFDRHLRRARRRNARRRNALIEALAEAVVEPHRVEGANAGLHLVLALSERDDAEGPELLRRLERAGVIVRCVSRYCESPLPCLKLIFGYATLNADSIRIGINTLGRVLRDHPPGPRP